MKTNPSARGIPKVRVTMLCLALAAIAVAEIRVGESLASRFGQVTASISTTPQAPNIGIVDLMAAAR